MKKTSKRLMSAFYLAVILELLIIVCFESDIILQGGFAGQHTAEFIIATIMELLSVIVVPIALRLIKYGAVQNIIRRDREEGLYKVSMLRMLLLIIPMLLNTLFYYHFLNVAFAYLAIVLAISLVFVIPTEKRCISETEGLW